MNRRSVLKSLGATTIAGSAVLGSGALTQVKAKRHVDINVTNDRLSALRLAPGGSPTGPDGFANIYQDNTSGEITFTTAEINQDGQLLVGRADSRDPTSDTTSFSDAAFTIADQTILGENTALGVDVSISSPTDVSSGLGMIFLPIDSTDDMANSNATGGKGYTPSDQDSVAGTGLVAGGTDMPSLPSRYQKSGSPDNDSARFLFDNTNINTVGVEMLIQADADDVSNTDTSFTVTVTAETVDTSSTA